MIITASLFLTPSRLTAQIDTDNVLLMGRSAIGADDYLTAIHYFNQVIEAKPFLNKPYYYRAYAKFSLDDFKGAEDDCTKAITINPYLVEVYQLRGLCRIHNDDFEGAIADYTRTLEELPDDQSAMYNRGLCHMQLKQYAEAKADMDHLLQRWPKFYRAYAIQAQICLAEKDTVQGLEWVDRLLSHNPDNGDAWSFKGRYALQKEQYAQADSCLTKAIALQPGRYEDYLARALARHGLNRFGDAIADYDETIRLVPQHFVAHYNRGLLLALVKDNNKAIEDFSFVIAQEPDNTLAIYNRALLRQETGDYRGAIADFTQLIRQYPNFLYGYMARAECRRKVGDTKGALNDESVVARANLDITFGQRNRRPVKKVRKRSEHDLDQYQQLVDEEENDSTGSTFGRLFASDLFGKVQNKKADNKPLAPFELTFRADSQDKGYRSMAFLPEAARLARNITSATLSFSADVASAEPTAVSERDIFGKRSGLFALSDSLLLLAVNAADTYNYTTALSLLNQAQAAHPDKSSALLIHIQRAAVLYHAYLTNQAEPAAELAASSSQRPSKETANISPLALALTELQEAQKTTSDNQYIQYNIGCIYAAMNDTQAAIGHFTQALSLDARFAEAYFNRGLLYLEQGEKGKAAADLSRAGELGLYKAYALLKQTR